VKFLITMNMPARSGVPIHQIICEYPANSVATFCDALENHDFIVVEEFYRNMEASGSTDAYYSVGLTAINHRYVGKIKELGNVTTAMKGRRSD
jgi:hypothetical protein